MTMRGTKEIWQTVEALQARSLSRADIAAALGCSEGSYKSALQDRRDKMRRTQGAAGHARLRVRWFQETWEKVDVLVAKGACEEEICSAIGCTIDAYRTARLMRRRKVFPKQSRDRSGSGWSDDDLAYLRAHYGHDMQTVEIGRHLGRGVRGIWAKARELGLRGKEPSTVEVVTEEEAEEAERRMDDGEDLKAIAASMRRGYWSLWTVVRRRKKARIQAAPAVPQASQASHQKTLRPWGAYPAGHPVSWGILQALLSPEHREAWPERPSGGPLATSCLSGVYRYAAKPKPHQRPKNPGLLELLALAA